MPVSEITHKGKTLIFCDYAELNAERCLQSVEELDARIRRIPGTLRVVSNFENAAIGPEFMGRIKAIGKQYNERVERQAVFGLSKMNMVLLAAYAKFTGATTLKSFGSKDEALDYAAS